MEINENIDFLDRFHFTRMHRLLRTHRVRASDTNLNRNPESKSLNARTFRFDRFKTISKIRARFSWKIFSLAQ